MSARPETKIERMPERGECPYCERVEVLRNVRLDWPNPPSGGPDDITAPMCRRCEEHWRDILRRFGGTYKKAGRWTLTLRHVMTMAQRRHVFGEGRRAA